MGKRGPMPGSGKSGGYEVGRRGGRPRSVAKLLRYVADWRAAGDEVGRLSLDDLRRCEAQLYALAEMFRAAVDRRVLSEVDNGQ